MKIFVSNISYMIKKCDKTPTWKVDVKVHNKTNNNKSKSRKGQNLRKLFH